ncbi:hypothetical protein JDV02_000356 [Purpureocillium takamizusanense]|uniref:Uncharacterized protein n=1 Tax=Purpureocillium takamizusanense TaxID=2060973 RepID=A0A9Q8Q6K6_9HYPO|nr:uncharacterized protein JDV02_000356 [Purpureocillium takamizusanense]UNI13631.1 hypothetical protein JDV02_000356 [Purpureocillium takamizusanense]
MSTPTGHGKPSELPMLPSNSTALEARSHSPEPADDSSRSASAASTRSRLTSKRPRSVSNMTELIPLRLSTSTLSFLSTPSSTPEPIGDRVDEYFPELLAQDLESSAEIFASRRMTAGTPVLLLSNEDQARIRNTRMGPSPPYLAASARVLSLGAIEERTSRVSFLEQQESQLEATTSDAESRMSSQTSEDMAPPSFRHRESVLTAATSVASASWKPSAIRSMPASSPLENSWIDCDSDCDSDEMDNCNIASLSPRPPTPPESDFDSGATGLRKLDMRGSWGHGEQTLHHKSHSVCGGSPDSHPRDRASHVSFDLPVRPSSTVGLRRHDRFEERRSCEAHTTKPSSAHMEQQQISTPQSRRVKQAAQELSQTPETGDKTDPPPATKEFLDCEAEATEMIYPAGPLTPLTAMPLSETAFARPPSPRPALRSVQSWLNSSLQPCPRVFNDDMSRVVPLPPDAMETLRVSIACFPETMLLSSSLTIDTIRTYSRKVRQPSLEIVRGPSPRTATPEMPSQTPRKSLWRKVMPHKRSAMAPDVRQRQSHSSGESSVASMSSSAAETPKPWEPLQNVFGSCSSYICDALYAHIVAYNYMSALVARNSTASGSRGTPSESQQEEIPKKAASLLGLGGTGEPGTAFNRHSRRATTSTENWCREEMVTTQPTAWANHENMQGGLLRCVVRLVAAARLMAEKGTSEDTMVGKDVDDVDLVLIRSLCEIVRMAEEASG